MKKALALVLSAASAYTLSFSADLFVGGVLHIYPTAVYKAVPIWTIIAVITGVIASILTRSRTLLTFPFAFITAFATFGGIVGRNYNFIVAGIMLLATLMVWLLTGARKPPTINSNESVQSGRN